MTRMTRMFILIFYTYILTFILYLYFKLNILVSSKFETLGNNVTSNTCYHLKKKD